MYNGSALLITRPGGSTTTISARPNGKRFSNLSRVPPNGVKKWSEHAWALTFHEDRQLKPEFQYHIKTHIKIDQNRIAMACIIQNVHCCCHNAVVLRLCGVIESLVLCPSKRESIAIDITGLVVTGGPATPQSSFICRKTSPRWSEPWGKVYSSLAPLVHVRCQKKEETPAATPSNAARGITTDRIPWRAA